MRVCAQRALDPLFLSPLEVERVKREWGESCSPRKRKPGGGLRVAVPLSALDNLRARAVIGPARVFLHCPFINEGTIK